MERHQIKEKTLKDIRKRALAIPTLTQSMTHYQEAPVIPQITETVAQLATGNPLTQEQRQRASLIMFGPQD